MLKALREPGKAARILLHKSLAPIGHNNYKHFVVLTRDRTGSNMLIQALKKSIFAGTEWSSFFDE